MSELKEEYVIKSIEEYPIKEGYVAITLIPTSKIEEDEPQIQMGVFPKGMEPPKEVMNGLQMMVKQAQKMNKQGLRDNREILLVVPQIDFYATSWSFGDILVVDFQKIKDGKEIKP